MQVDHFQVGGTSLYEIAEDFHTLGGKVLALDEIHKYPNWSQELKSLYDTFPKLNIVASGSSALQMHKGSHDLSRRAIKYNLFGLSFREYLELRLGIELSAYSLTEILQNHARLAGNVMDILAEKGEKVIALFHHYLACGYYPYFSELPNEELYFMTLEQNLHTTIESDLAAIHPHLSGSSINKLKQLLIFIAKAVPFTPNWNKLKDLLDIGDVRTLKTYFGYLEDAYLIRSVSKKTQKLSHLASPEKVYLDNPNQMHTLSLGDHIIGTQREIFFIDMLSLKHEVELADKGDFLIDKTYLFEVGGRKKGFEQIKNKERAYLACDEIESGAGSKIPLWLFGLLY